MKILTLFCILSISLAPNYVESICISTDGVLDVQSIMINDEWYISIYTEPMYLHSNRVQTVSKIKEILESKYVGTFHVIIDHGLMMEIKRLKALPVNNTRDKLIDRFLTNYNEVERTYEYNRYYPKEKTW